MSLTLGIDIGGTKIAAALVRNGAIIEKVERAYQRSSVIEDLATAIKELDPTREVGSVGIACAGLIDSERKSGWQVRRARLNPCIVVDEFTR